MAIWFREYKLDELQELGKDTMLAALGIEFTEIGENFLSGRMPIDSRTVQPMRILHGGASAALAETLGSLASQLIIHPDKQMCVGTSIYANHLRPGKSGFANGKAEIIHLGRSSHIWNIDIRNDEGKLLCVCRLTMAVLDKKI